jgi:hypothetical protein
MLTKACPPSAWAQICAKAVAQAIDGDGRAREWLSLYLMPRPNADVPQLARLAAAAALNVNLREVDAVGVYHEISTARSDCEVASNFLAAREAGRKLNGLTDALAVGLFGPNGQGDGHDNVT